MYLIFVYFVSHQLSHFIIIHFCFIKFMILKYIYHNGFFSKFCGIVKPLFSRLFFILFEVFFFASSVFFSCLFSFAISSSLVISTAMFFAANFIDSVGRISFIFHKIFCILKYFGCKICGLCSIYKLL